MRYLHKEYYNFKNFSSKKNKAKERINYDSTINTKLKIKPMDQPDEFYIYYVPTNTTIELVAEISRLDLILEYIYEELPGLAQRNFFVDMLSMELQSTNELEGVRSSKEEIVRTTRKMLGNSSKTKETKARFKNVIRSYFELKEGNLKPPVDSKDCRKIYNEITADGVSKENDLDGKYFRKNVTYIYKNDKQIHRGITAGEETEEIIIKKINNLLRFMNNSDIELHQLIKIAISHYYFGYIHPFYDGNGRTGRFISSIFLKENYSWLTAMSLSQGCSRERIRYLKIFDQSNQISSQGEINYFVDEFLSIILVGQRNILENLVRKRDLLTKIFEKISIDENLPSEDEKQIMNVMAQEYHFNPSADGIGVNELKEVFDYTDETIRLKLREVYAKGLIEKIKSRPVRYVISRDYLEN